MLCSICQKNPATIHIQEISGSEKKILHLCQACAEKKAQEDSAFKEFNLAEVLMQLSGELMKKEGSASKPLSPEYEKIFCKTCGWDYASSIKTGKLGCPDCYQSFAGLLKNGLHAMHKGTVHVGKTPCQTNSAAAPRCKTSVAMIKMNLSRLQTELELAVAGEKYETAAILRDKIAELRADLKKASEA